MGSWTYDYYKIPENMRAELIDGDFYEMESQSLLEQMVSGYIGAQLLEDMERKGLDWTVLFASPSVRLDKDKWTVVEPDLIIVCEREKLQRKRIEGSPDFVLEITSTATRKKDLSLKTYKYERAGVKIYFILEPDRKRLLIYDFRMQGNLEVISWGKEAKREEYKIVSFELEGHVFNIDMEKIINTIDRLE